LMLFLPACGSKQPTAPPPEAHTEQPLQDTPQDSNETGVTVRIAPTAIEVNTGDIVDVAVNVEGIADLYGAELHLRFDPTLLEVIDADAQKEGFQIAHGNLLAPDFVAINEADPTSGTIDYAIVHLAPRGAASGNGTLATLKFKGRSSGKVEVNPEEILLATSDGEQIAVSIEY